MAATAPTAGLAGRHLFLFGLGHVAGRLVPMARRAGIGLSGSCRSTEAVARWRAQGVRAHVFEGRTALPAAALVGVTDVLVSIPPDPDPAATACRVLWPHAGLLPPLRWVGVLSSTAVYGDHGGAWIDETAACRPATADARARLRAEAEWRAFGRMTRTPVDLMRLPGIYGPGRSVLDALRAGQARRIVKPGHVFNRIHADDIAACVLAAMARPRRRGTPAEPHRRLARGRRSAAAARRRAARRPATNGHRLGRSDPARDGARLLRREPPHPERPDDRALVERRDGLLTLRPKGTAEAEAIFGRSTTTQH